MNLIAIPQEVFSDNKLSKNSLRLLAHIIKLHRDNTPFVVHDALGEIRMTYKAYTRARDTLLTQNYLVAITPESHKMVRWKLSDKTLALLEVAEVA